MNLKLICLLIAVFLLTTIPARAQVPITYEEHVEYQDGGCYPNTGCWTDENIYIKNTDTVGGVFVFILDANPRNQSFPIYISGGSSYIFNAGSFPKNRDTTYPPIPYSITAPTKTDALTPSPSVATPASTPYYPTATPTPYYPAQTIQPYYPPPQQSSGIEEILITLFVLLLFGGIGYVAIKKLKSRKKTPKIESHPITPKIDEQLTQLKVQKTKFSDTLLKLDERYNNKEISEQNYKELKAKYESQLKEIEKQIVEIELHD